MRRPTIVRVSAILIPTGLLVPYRPSSARLATIVGSANGRSMTAFRIRLPGNWSRTSTQATSVPITEPIRATIADITSVCQSAFSASGLVNESQNASRPDPSATLISAATGIRTITLR